MSDKKTFLILLTVILVVVLGACASLDRGFNFTGQHMSAEDLGMSTKTCTDCHDAGDENLPYGRFVHDPYFADNHRQEAYQYAQVCGVCHQTSFCNDCHATRVELRPSLKNQTETDRRMPHRGDYLTRHRIDGKIDPTSCFRCHGNPKTAKTCVPCHG